MANIPGMTGQIPGVFGPTNTEIVKTEKGYAIGWAPIKSWGKPFIEGTTREIAKDIITKFGQLENRLQGPIPFYGCIMISLKPDFVITLRDSVKSSYYINQEFLISLEKELSKLLILIPFL